MIIESKLEVSDQEFDSELGTVQTVPIPGPKGDPGEKGEKGDKGDKGDPGVVKFTVVKELPEQGTDDAIYLVPVSGGTAINMYDEYIFVDGVWEKIGSTAVEVDLTDYVKKTDYPNAGIKSGVVNVDPTNFGIGAYPTSGILYITPATDAQIDAKEHARRPIAPSNLDYAIKKGLADNKLEWTDEEKKAALLQLGSDTADGYGLFPIRKNGGRILVATPSIGGHATNKSYVDNNFVPKQTSDRTSVYAVNSSGEQILVGTCQNAANNGMIPRYSSNGNINVSTPTGDSHAANKAYVDGLVGNIEAALDAIIALQNQHIGGESV